VSISGEVVRARGRTPGPYNPAVDVRTLSALPGSDLVIEGLSDLELGRETANSLLVLIGAPRLRSLGIDVPAHENAVPPEHRLYALLDTEDSGSAHGRYNALVRRLVSFERALACVHPSIARG
jgi:hypothetical protein